MKPCIGCAACCHNHSNEDNYCEVLSGVDDVPEAMTHYIGNQQYMNFINGVCVALNEVDGSCSIYDQRPTVCKQFKRGSRSCYMAIYKVFGTEYLELSLR